MIMETAGEVNDIVKLLSAVISASVLSVVIVVLK